MFLSMLNGQAKGWIFNIMTTNDLIMLLFVCLFVFFFLQKAVVRLLEIWMDKIEQVT